MLGHHQLPHLWLGVDRLGIGIDGRQPVAVVVGSISIRRGHRLERARVGTDVLNEVTPTARGAVPGWMGSTGTGRGEGDSSSTMTSRRGFRGARGFDCDARRKVASCGVVVGTS